MFNWNFFPHTNFNEINLDWILDCLKALTGGDTGKILAKHSANDFDFEWVDDSGGGGGTTIDPYNSNPSALGTASPGVSQDYSRGDHVHAKPTAADIGAIAAPQNPSDGQFLVYDSDLGRWIAYTLPVYNGGVI